MFYLLFVLQWRKFSFFDVTGNVDGGRLSEALKVRVLVSGLSCAVINDWIISFSLLNFQ